MFEKLAKLAIKSRFWKQLGASSLSGKLAVEPRNYNDSCKGLTFTRSCSKTSYSKFIWDTEIYSPSPSVSVRACFFRDLSASAKDVNKFPSTSREKIMSLEPLQIEVCGDNFHRTLFCAYAHKDNFSNDRAGSFYICMLYLLSILSKQTWHKHA